MLTELMKRRTRPEWVWIGALVAGCSAAATASLGVGQPASSSPTVAGVPVPAAPPSAEGARPNDRASESLPWRLNNPAPNIIPESRANPAAVADKFAARVRSLDQRASIRAYEGAPPVIPHPIADLNIQTCRACHAQGLRAGDKVARMVSHTYLVNCTQCHVEAAGPLLGADASSSNSFVGLRSSGYGGMRAWAGAPPVMPHTTFMRTNCVSCHGEHGYDGWRPDHLSRTNCVQCHAPAAEFDQLAPTFGVPDVADGQAAGSHR
jgi:cytochrome c-type protein NapB